MPNVTVLYFAGVAERLARESDKLDLPEKTSVNAIFALLKTRYPQLGDQLATCRLAIDHQFVRGDVDLAPGSELAVIPPVSGG